MKKAEWNLEVFSKFGKTDHRDRNSSDRIGRGEGSNLSGASGGFFCTLKTRLP